MLGENGEWLINEAQAAIVREIYNMYTCGISVHRIASMLNEKGIFTINGNKWTAQSILIVLRNEKYVGDLIMQKFVTTDMLAHKVVKNKGIAKQFYIKNHHVPIIDRNVWDKVQVLVEHNTFEEAKIKSKDRFAVLSNLYCGVCGKPYIRQRYSTKAASLCTSGFECRFAYAILKCEENTKKDKSTPKLMAGEKRCKSEYLHECGVFQSFMEKLCLIKADILANDDEAEIIKSYYALCVERAKKSDSILFHDYSEVVDQIGCVKKTIQELADNQEELTNVIGEEGMFQSLINDYESQLIELEKNKEELITKIILADPYVKQFEYFVDSVIALPEISSEKKYLIPFNKSMYLTFINAGIVYGDVIEYSTNFGVNFRTTGNTRKMADFIGYWCVDNKGDSIEITNTYQVVGTSLQYFKRKTG